MAGEWPVWCHSWYQLANFQDQPLQIDALNVKKHRNPVTTPPIDHTASQTGLTMGVKAFSLIY